MKICFLLTCARVELSNLESFSSRVACSRLDSWVYHLFCLTLDACLVLYLLAGGNALR
jgi:hypothetical protein